MSRLEDASYETFENVCLLLQAGHKKRNDTPEQTLNRLFRKHLHAHKQQIATDPPYLSSGNTIVTMESWATPALRKLAPRSNSRPPQYENFPVVIVRYRDHDCLIDGGSRIHAWHEAGDSGCHLACVLTVL
jgi:hypothetical protein